MIPPPAYGGWFDLIKIDPAKMAARQARRASMLSAFKIDPAKRATRVARRGMVATKGRDWWRSLDPQTQARLLEGGGQMAARLIHKQRAGTITDDEALALDNMAMQAGAPQAGAPSWLLPAAAVGGGVLLLLVVLASIGNEKG